MLLILGLAVVECNECKNGREHYCSPLTTKNLGINVNGGYAEYVLVPHSKYLFDAGNTPDEVAGSYACRGLTAYSCLLYTSPSPRDTALSRMPSSA